ncbi:MAG: hypothetical protein JXB20_03795 [Bacilli bacterium]|nr:hypothetical protein [Bacilli bacterium]MBN2696903.1 hypothetical protein [Bacilli bacterium]
MKNLEWLMQGDDVIVHLVKKYLLEENSVTNNTGYIEKYLDLFDAQTLTWGRGFYGPKWTSTHYTLMELKYMEIDPTTYIYQASLDNYVLHMWKKYQLDSQIERLDLCIIGMMLGLLAYAKTQNDKMNAMIDCILSTVMPDGGWNCRWNHSSKPRISSVHTTINILEGLGEYIDQGYPYRSEDVFNAMQKGIAALLERRLYQVKQKRIPIHPSMAEHHYPPRWKYDYLRVLEFLAKRDYPHCEEMNDALDLLVSKLIKGKLTRGSTISGLIHFPLETERFGRFNTLRAYIILKTYRDKIYKSCVDCEF